MSAAEAVKAPATPAASCPHLPPPLGARASGGNIPPFPSSPEPWAEGSYGINTRFPHPTPSLGHPKAGSTGVPREPDPQEPPQTPTPERTLSCLPYLPRLPYPVPRPLSSPVNYLPSHPRLGQWARTRQSGPETQPRTLKLRKKGPGKGPALEGGWPSRGEAARWVRTNPVAGGDRGQRPSACLELSHLLEVRPPSEAELARWTGRARITLHVAKKPQWQHEVTGGKCQED